MEIIETEENQSRQYPEAKFYFFNLKLFDWYSHIKIKSPLHFLYKLNIRTLLKVGCPKCGAIARTTSGEIN